MPTSNNKILQIFIDESGDFNFSPKGTKYFVLTCISSLNPLVGRDKFLQLKYKLLADGTNEEYFHASEDKQLVRNKVFDLIKDLDDFEIHSVIAQKNKVNWSLYEEPIIGTSSKGFNIKVRRVEEKIYKQISETLLKYVIKRYVEYKNIQIDKVMVIFGAVFTRRKHEFIKKYIKSYFKKKYGKTPYTYFHQVKADINCQISDYCGWAIYIKWEREEIRPYKQIKNKIQSEFDIFEIGDTVYYKYEK